MLSNVGSKAFKYNPLKKSIGNDISGAKAPTFSEKKSTVRTAAEARSSKQDFLQLAF